MAPRVAVTAVFLANGAVFGGVFARLPAIQARVEAGEAELGLALLCASLGLLLAQPLTGVLVARRGSAPVTRWAAPVFCAAAVGPGLAETPLALGAALGVMGAANGVLDVAMNVQGLEVERRLRRRMFASFHAAFSLGAFAGSAAGAAAAALGIDLLPHLAGAAAALTGLSLLAGRGLLPGAVAPGGPAFARPTPALMAVAAIAFCALLAEGAVNDWSAVLLRTEQGAGPAIAAAGLAAFSLAMAAGRLAADGAAARLGPARVARGGGLLAAAGLGLALASGRPAASIAGLVCMGTGLAAIFPLALQAASTRGDAGAGPAVAAVSTAGYVGFITGPPVIGFAAEATSLSAALVLVVGLCLAAAALARAVRPRPTATARA